MVTIREDVLEGTDGNDILYSIVDGEGDYYYKIAGWLGNDKIYAGGLRDYVWAGGGDDIVYGYNGDDDIYGQDGVDVLHGEEGIDYLFGGNDGDFLYGGAGNDSMWGESGSDHYFVDQSNDNVIEAVNAGNDSVHTTINFTLPNNVEHLFLGGTAISGVGNNLPNTVQGNGSANTINGMDGNDFLSGLGGNDTILGGNGNDLIRGGNGIDHSTGNSGADTFDFDYVTESPEGNNRDLITDFTPGSDKLDLSTIDANLNIAGNQAFTASQGSYVSGILTADVIGGADIQIGLIGAPALNASVDIIL